MIVPDQYSGSMMPDIYSAFCCIYVGVNGRIASIVATMEAISAAILG